MTVEGVKDASSGGHAAFFAMQRTDAGEDADIARKARVGTKHTQSLKYKSFTVKDSL